MRMLSSCVNTRIRTFIMGERIHTSPISYELDGRQYVLNSAGGVMFAWTLPPTGTQSQEQSSPALFKKKLVAFEVVIL
jgi:hypothetical protein